MYCPVTPLTVISKTLGRSVRAIPFLYFKGDCESTLKFHDACGPGKIVELTPPAERDGASWNQKVSYSRFEGRWINLYASDGPDSEPMKGCAIFIEIDEPDAEKLFDALAARLSAALVVPDDRRATNSTREQRSIESARVSI